MDEVDPRNQFDQLSRLGRNSDAASGAVNLPVYYTSTVLFDTVEAFKAARERRYEKGQPYYGRYSTPATFELEEMVAKLEGGFGGILVGSGLSAVTLAIMSFVSAGSHILITDAAYGPTKHFCGSVLSQMGVETTYYDPMMGDAISDLIRPETAVIFMESPSSGTFEVQDVPALASAARRRGVTTIIDSTWATPLFLKPLHLGVDVVVHSGTKYLSGHSDAMIGAIVTNEEHYQTVRRTVLAIGARPGPEEVFLTLRGLRTLAVRMNHHYSAALTVAEWLAEQPAVERVLHPALRTCPGHDFWKRDFSGASGVFAVQLKPCSEETVSEFIDGLELFSIGLSWGGYESLVLPVELPPRLSQDGQFETGLLVRISIGLDSPASLIADLDAGFSHLGANSRIARRPT